MRHAPQASDPAEPTTRTRTAAGTTAGTTTHPPSTLAPPTLESPVGVDFDLYLCHDDGTWITLEVRHVGSACDPAAEWHLSFAGNTSGK